MREPVGELSRVQLSTVERAVGSSSFKRGRAYASKRVLKLQWDPEIDTLLGTVLGQGALYDTAAYFSAGADGELAFAEGDCTCPIGYNCKHVAAIVIAAGPEGTQARGGYAPLVPASPVPAVLAAPRMRSTAEPPEPSPHAWELALRTLIDGPARRQAGDPLAIALELRAGGTGGRTTDQLHAKLMRPGTRGWISGSLSWTGLEPYNFHAGELREDHLEVARELFAIHGARARRPSYYYGYSQQKTIDLAACDSPQLWSVLDDAQRLGLQLIHSKVELVEIPCHRGEVVLDVSARDDGMSVIRPRLRLSAGGIDDLEPQLFIGSNGHGIAAFRGGDERDPRAGRRLALIRLANPAPIELQRMLLQQQELPIPAAQLERFAEQVSPELRAVAPVVSSDGSFTPPEISAPTLVLRAQHGPQHTINVGWEWQYKVGPATRRTTLAAGPGHSGFRDLAAEREVLEELDLGPVGLDGLALIDGGGRPAPAEPLTLTGLDSLRLSTEILPALNGRTDLSVEIVGDPPDYRNVDELLEIGVSTQEIAGERDWFDLGVVIMVEGRELPFAEVFAALARGASRMLLDDGAHFSLQTPALESLRELIAEAQLLTDSPSGELRISRYQTGLWEELAALGGVKQQADGWRRHVEALRAFDTGVMYEQPSSLAATLRPYQHAGFAWLASLWQLGLGGILADDMGLGKTLQTLGLICHARAADEHLGPMLVVAPTSVVSNWVAETARFAPSLRIQPVTDTLAKSSRTIAEIVDQADIVVTTYTLLRLEHEAYNTVAWAGVILDEAQFVKNHHAKTYAAVKQLPAPFKLAVTGTPMENNLMELWSLLSITAPGLFPDPKRFAEHYAKPIERGDDSGERLALLRRRIRPLVKRRTKELVAADLPAKQEQTLEIDLHPRHRKIYDTQLQRERQRILKLIDDFDKNRFTILRSITMLRQLSLHPGLGPARHEGVPCAKLGALVEQLEDVIGGGHRALVFSQFTGFLAKVTKQLAAAGVSYCYLDGQTTKRGQVVERFKQGSDPVFVISLKAGGFGLNLTEADYCFMLDPWWNPAAEAQAVDRTHRIGQTRPVNVYRMIAKGTIEEKVVALAARKAELFRGVMDDGDLFAANMTAEDIVGLLG